MDEQINQTKPNSTKHIQLQTTPIPNKVTKCHKQKEKRFDPELVLITLHAIQLASENLVFFPPNFHKLNVLIGSHCKPVTTIWCCHITAYNFNLRDL